MNITGSFCRRDVLLEKWSFSADKQFARSLSIEILDFRGSLLYLSKISAVPSRSWPSLFEGPTHLLDWKKSICRSAFSFCFRRENNSINLCLFRQPVSLGLLPRLTVRHSNSNVYSVNIARFGSFHYVG